MENIGTSTGVAFTSTLTQPASLNAAATNDSRENYHVDDERANWSMWDPAADGLLSELACK